MLNTNLRSVVTRTVSSDTALLRLLLVAENRLVGEALAATLTDNPSVAMVTCASLAQALILAATTLVDAILVDASDAGNSWMVARLRTVVPLRPIIACAVRETDDDVLLWAEAGVTGYLPNTIHPAQAIEFISAILSGEQLCSGRAAAALLRRIAAIEPTVGPAHELAGSRHLTRRELQVAELISAGLSDKQVARDLGISLATTKTHVHNLLGKLNLRHRSEVGPSLARAGTRLRVALLQADPGRAAAAD